MTDTCARSLVAKGRRWLWVAMVGVAAATLSCTPAPLRVLFVGNSYTATNDLPGMVQQLASAAKGRLLETSSTTPGGFTIKQHWESGVATGLLGASHYDWMVLQDQSQEPGLDAAVLEVDLYPYVTQFANAASNGGTNTMLFLTWARQQGDQESFPGDTYTAMQARVAQGYETIGARLDLEVSPVGIAWRTTLLQQPTIALWQSDGSHPTVAGTYLASCVFYEMLFGRVAGNAFMAGLAAPQAAALQQIAATTVASYTQP